MAPTEPLHSRPGYAPGMRVDATSWAAIARTLAGRPGQGSWWRKPSATGGKLIRGVPVPLPGSIRDPRGVKEHVAFIKKR